MMKRTLSLLLIMVMVLAIAPASMIAKASDSVFSDVKDDDYYAWAANTLVEKNVLTGYPDGTFCADKSITRAEMAAVVCRMIDVESEAKTSTGSTDFDDVDDTHWARGYVKIATDKGIINGDGNGKFRPQDSVKFEEAIKMVVCALELDDKSDAEVDANDWTKVYIEAAREYDISDNLRGKKGQNSTRGDVAVMVYNGIFVDYPAPVPSFEPGVHRGIRNVRFTTTMEGADIYYTTNGDNPLENGKKYEDGVSLTKDCVLKAIAVDGDQKSKLFTGEYIIKSYNGSGSDEPEDSAEYTVSFDVNCDDATGAPKTQKVTEGELAEQPEAPKRNGYEFVGWYTDDGYNEMFDFSEGVTQSYKLVARWNNIWDTIMDPWKDLLNHQEIK